VYILPNSRYDTTNMSEETTPTTIDATAVQKAAAIFCQPPATDTAQPPPDTTTAVTAAKPALTPDEIAIIQSLIDEVAQAEHLTVTADGLAGAGVSHLDRLACVRMTRGLLLFCEGRRWKEVSAALGVNWAVWDMWTGPKYIKKVATAAMDRKDRAVFQDILDAAQGEAVNDIEEYVIGRVGKDEDGILRGPDGNHLKKRKPSTKMRELFLKANDKRFRDSGSDAEKGAGSRPIVYNIAFFGTNPAAASVPKAAEAIEATFSEVSGGNQAENSPFG
jgi:hypothetical protein